MSKPSQPELKKFMDKRVLVQLQGDRKVTGVLRGFDIFLNVVLDDTSDESIPARKEYIGQTIIRGQSVVIMEALSAIQ